MHGFANLSIRYKLALGFSAIALLITVGMLANLFAQNDAERANRNMRKAFEQALYAEQLRSNALASDRSIKEGTLAYLSRGVESMITPFDNADQYLQDSLDTLRHIRLSANDPALTETLDSLEQNLTSIQSDLSTIIIPQAERRGSATTGQIGILIAQLANIQAGLDADTHPALVAEIEALKTALVKFLPDPGTLVDSLAYLNSKINNVQAFAAEANLPEAEQAELVAQVRDAEIAIAGFLASDLLMGLRIADSIEKVDATSRAVSDYVAIQKQAQAAAQLELDDARERAQVIQILIGGTVFVLAVLLSILISWSIARPLQTLTAITGQIAQGDYDRKTQIATHDEIGRLAQSIDSMVTVIKIRETDLRSQTDQLRIATAKAHEAARIKGEFLANMSHELRTPLNAIIGFSDILLMGMTGELNPRQQHQITRLRENGLRLLDLVNDVLDLARIEAKRVEFSPKPFAPRDLIESIQNQVAPLASKKSLAFTTVIDPRLPETVTGDAKRISQVVVNLLSNAFKFTQEGEVTLTAGLRPENPTTWGISVQDTGVGIPPHALELIFEEFRQVDGSSTRAFGGTGLGLAISRQLARIMGGQVTVTSQLGKGSTFTLLLPLQPVGLLELAAADPAPELSAAMQEV